MSCRCALPGQRKRAGIEQFLLVSSVGADPGSSNFYLRTKGELERDLAALKLPALHIFRPGLLLGRDRNFACRRHLPRGSARC